MSNETGSGYALAISVSSGGVSLGSQTIPGINFTANTPVTQSYSGAVSTQAGTYTITASITRNGITYQSGTATVVVGSSAVNGACGASNGAGLTSKPATGLCTAGTASSVSGSGPWSWSCTGSDGGTTASCSAILATNGACGSANGVTVNSAPSANLCSVGSSSSVTGSGPFNWTCAGSNGGSTASCSAPRTTTTAVNGTCGSANGVAAISAPSANLCGTGTASAVSGSGPWSWSCTGSNGGSKASCSAQLASCPAGQVISGTVNGTPICTTLPTTPTTPGTWQSLKVGAGGFVRSLDIASDGTTIGRTDTNGAYLWNASTSSWSQLATANSMPASFFDANPSSTGQGGGVFELRIANSNTQIFYMIYNGYMFKSTNRGTNWTQLTSFNNGTAVGGNANDNYGSVGQKMAIDPNNANIVIAGSETTGLLMTTDGGTTWTNISAVPAGTNAGMSGIAFVPGAPAGVVNGATQTIFACSNGNGIYESTNGGKSWAEITTSSAGPTTVQNSAISSTGVYYVTDTNNVWSYANGTWKLLPTGGIVNGDVVVAVAVNPANTNEIAAATSAGRLNLSYDAGSTWTGYLGNSTLISATDIPWEQSANEWQGQPNSYAYIDVGNIAFDPTRPNQLVLSGGTGVWTATIPTTTPSASVDITDVDESIGIENLVANEIISPPGGSPVLASWDRPFFKITNINQYPTTYGPVDSDTIVAGWSVDYASSSPSFIVGIAEFWGVEESGYSKDGGATWTPFATEIPNASSSFMGGTIAASTPSNIIWAPADGFQPYYTLDGGQSWNLVTLPGVSSWSSFDWAYYLDTRTVTADRVLSNTFYLFYAGQGLYETTNGGASWTQKYSGDITPWDGYNAKLIATPAVAGELFFTGGPQSPAGATPADEPFMRSTNQGTTWTAVPNVEEVLAFGYGMAAPGQSNPALYIVGWVNGVYGTWESDDATNPSVTTPHWTNIGTQPANGLDQVNTISGDMNVYGQAYAGFAGGGYAVLVAPQ